MGDIIRCECTNDPNRIIGILLDDAIVGFLMADPGHVLKSRGTFRSQNAVNYVFSDDGKDVGLAIVYLYPHISAGVVDIGFVSEFRGKNAKEAAILALNDFKKRYPDVLLISKLLKDNKRALGFSRMCGFKHFRQDERHYWARLKDESK